jgi:hypothetical protein
LTALLGSLLPSTARAQETVTLAGVLDRLGTYLADYADRLPATIASEHYEQRVGSGARYQQVVLESEFGIIRVPGDPEWLGLRDVVRVDGKPVPDHASRLESLFLNPSPLALQQAKRIATESSRYNVGPVLRTINDPSFVLELLDPRNAARMRFTKDGDDTLEKTPVWIVRFEEWSSPTIMRSGDAKDQPANGRAWVDPVTGRLMRAEAAVESGLTARDVNAKIQVTFQSEPRLGFWVPAKMTEEYQNKRLVTLSSGVATYSNYRKFSVDTYDERKAP